MILVLLFKFLHNDAEHTFLVVELSHNGVAALGLQIDQEFLFLKFNLFAGFRFVLVLTVKITFGFMKFFDENTIPLLFIFPSLNVNE